MNLFHFKLASLGRLATGAAAVLVVTTMTASAMTVSVKPGDTLWTISRQHGVSLAAVEAANPKINPLNMLVGTQISLPGGAASHSAATAHTALQQRSTQSSSTEQQNLYWMEHVIHAEAGGETLQAQIAVGDVVLHRMESAGNPNTVKGVVFQISGGHYQFSCVPNGYIYTKPTGTTIQAAVDVLDKHMDVVPGAQVFFNPAQTSASNWVWNQPAIAHIDHFIFAS